MDRLGIEFIDLEDDDEDDGDAELVSVTATEAQPEVDGPERTPAAPEVVEELPEDTHDLGKSFDDEVEAEVAELLGEVEPPAAGETGSTDDEKH